MTRSSWSAAVSLLIAFGLAGWWSQAPLLQDDCGFLMWADAGGPWWHGLVGPPFLEHLRPLSYAPWWWLGPLSAGEAIRWLQCLLWALVVAGLTWLGTRSGKRGGMVLGFVGLVAFQPFVDLLGWRSWLSTTGALLGILGGVVATLAARPGGLGLAGLIALGFKEPGGFVTGALGLGSSIPASRLVGGGLAVLAAGVSLFATNKVGLAELSLNLNMLLLTVGSGAWLVPVALHTLGVRGRWALVSVGLVLLPKPIAGVAVLGVSLALVRPFRPLLLGLLVAWSLPLFGLYQAQQYYLEGWLLVIVALVLRPRPVPPWLLVLTVLAAVPEGVRFERSRAELRQQAQAQALSEDPTRIPDCTEPVPGSRRE